MACNVIKSKHVPLKDCLKKLQPLTQAATYAETKGILIAWVCNEVKVVLPKSSNKVCAEKLEPFAEFILDFFVVRE
jgi:hypothetical protein